MTRHTIVSLMLWLLTSLAPHVATSQETWSLAFQGLSRWCIVDFPPSRAGQTSLPVVFALHGYGGNASTFRTNRRIQIHGDTAGFVTVYPNAVDAAWNSGISDGPGMPTPNVDDVGFISRIIDSLIVRFQIDPSRVYACGFSNGGFMSLKLAGQLSQRIAAVGSVGGVLTPTTAALFAPVRPVPAVLIHGTGDGDVPYFGWSTYWYSVDSTVAFLARHNLCDLPPEAVNLPDRDPYDGSTVERWTFRSSRNSSQILLYKVWGGGHTWPRYSTTAAATNRDIEATFELWNFFRQYSLTTSANEDAMAVPLDHELLQNYPNPFNPETKIGYRMKEKGWVRLSVANVLGQEVAVLAEGEQEAGSHEAVFGRRSTVDRLPSGIYFYRISVRTDGGQRYEATKKMVLMK